jgi:hypothetical protein
MPWEEDAKKNIEDHEGNTPYPYIDTAFKITVGIGSNIDNKTEFMGLPWKIGANGPDATKQDIETAYEELTRQKSIFGNIKTVKEKGRKKRFLKKKQKNRKHGLLYGCHLKKCTGCLKKISMSFATNCRENSPISIVFHHPPKWR